MSPDVAGGLMPDEAEDWPFASGGMAMDAGVRSKIPRLRTAEDHEVPQMLAETRGRTSLFPSTGLGAGLVLV